MILLVGHTHAGELDLVFRKLYEMGMSQKIIRMNLNDIAYATPITVHVGDGHASIEMHHPVRRRITLDNIKLAWLAYAPTLWTDLTDEINSWPLVEAIESDLKNQFWGIVELLRARGTQWVNEPSAVLRASKIAELFYAMQIGFSVPNTIVTAYEPDLDSYIGNGSMIVKSLQSQSVSLSKEDWLASYTKLLSKEQAALLQRRRPLNAPPVIIQPFIEKSYEVRLFIFMKRDWAIKIKSHLHPDLRVDWRRQPYLADEYMEKTTIPVEVMTKSRQLLTTLGLRSGAFDFIVDKQGIWHFLEVNRTPSWNWMSRHVGEDIAEGIASELMREWSEIA